MKPRFKENPSEWRKFVLVWAILAGGLTFMLARRSIITSQTAWTVGALLWLWVCAGLARPHWFRLPYRIVMTGSFHVGQFMGRVMLACIFLFLLTPLSIILRMTGKDLLGLRRNASCESYWKKSKPSDAFDRQF